MYGLPTLGSIILRVSARSLASKDRMFGMKVSESDPFYRIWKCYDMGGQNKQLVVCSQHLNNQANPVFPESRIGVSVVNDPRVTMFLIEFFDWDERSPYDPKGVNDMIGYAMITPAQFFEGIDDHPLTWSHANQSAHRQVPGYFTIKTRVEAANVQTSMPGGYPPQTGVYPPPGQYAGYPPQQAMPGYPPQQVMPGYPPQPIPGYPPQQPMPGYAPQQPMPGYPPQPMPGYAPQQPMPGYPPQQPMPGYPPQQQPMPGYPPQQQPPYGQYPPSGPYPGYPPR